MPDVIAKKKRICTHIARLHRYGSHLIYPDEAVLPRGSD